MSALDSSPSFLPRCSLCCWKGLLCLAISLHSSSLSGQVAEADLELRLNQVQVIGTHNSYHLAPSPDLSKLIAFSSPDLAASIDYSHAPLRKQLDVYGMRQLEFDLYQDPLGGRYSRPAGWILTGQAAQDSRLTYNFARELTRPGFKVIHSPGFDFLSTTPSLEAALHELVSWSAEHPGHFPLLIMLELKEAIEGPAGVSALPFDSAALDELDRVLASRVPASQRIIPDDLRQRRGTLREAVLEEGWPSLGECRGRLLFALDNTGAVRDRYLEGHSTLEGRMMFASVDREHPAAAWMKRNDPISDCEEIRQLVRQGFLVRTRADAETRAARVNDTQQRDQAFASGAQYISTDFPRCDSRFSSYEVRWEDGAIYRRNPVNSPK
jgi:hypothetical protein